MAENDPDPEKLNHRVGLSDEDKLEIIRLINTYASQRGPQSGPNDMQRRSAFYRHVKGTTERWQRASEIR